MRAFTPIEAAHGIFRYISEDPDTVWAYFISHKIDYLILGHLRTNPNQQIKEYFINSLHFNAFRLLENKPDCLELIYYQGNASSAFLFRINQENILQTKPERYRQTLRSGHHHVHPSNFGSSSTSSRFWAYSKNAPTMLSHTPFIS